MFSFIFHWHLRYVRRASGSSSNESSITSNFGGKRHAALCAVLLRNWLMELSALVREHGVAKPPAQPHFSKSRWSKVQYLCIFIMVPHLNVYLRWWIKNFVLFKFLYWFFSEIKWFLLYLVKNLRYYDD